MEIYSRGRKSLSTDKFKAGVGCKVQQFLRIFNAWLGVSSIKHFLSSIVHKYLM